MDALKTIGALMADGCAYTMDTEVGTFVLAEGSRVRTSTNPVQYPILSHRRMHSDFPLWAPYVDPNSQCSPD